MLSVLVCAYNEEKTIGTKIENLLAIDKGNIITEIIVIDDNSTDKTGEIAARYSGSSKKIAVFKNEHKKGKWGALLTGLRHAQGDIICITDADVKFEDDALKKILPLFDDPSVGAVTAKQKNVLIKNGIETAAPLSLYEKFKNVLREFESKMDSTASFHGQCMLARKECLRLPQEGPMCDDVYIAILVRKEGYRTLFCGEAHYIEKIDPILNRNSVRIFKRRAKASAQVMIANRDLLFNPRYKRFGLVCFPIEFFLHIVFPFLIFGGAPVAMFTLSFFLGYDFLVMAWLQMVSVAECLINLGRKEGRWETAR